MPSRAQTIFDAVQLFDSVSYPTGCTAATAWLGIYQVLLWYEHGVPHIIDADKLRKAGAWLNRAAAVESYLATQLGVPRTEVQKMTDLLMRSPQFDGMQRQNPLGTAFSGLVKHILETFGNPEITYELEVDAALIYPTAKFPGRSKAPRVDILARKSSLPRAIISGKWSARHDRINEITNECPVYKQAASFLRQNLDFIVVTNEFDPARLHKILGDNCIDKLVHVHKPNLIQVCGLNGRLNLMLDLSDLVAMTFTW
jgi:hypothetical protein